MAVQDRQMITRFKSQIEQEKLPLDKDWKKNLETHKIVDLLADREAESVKQWLAAHPEVEFVSRDRGGVYIDGASARSTAGNAGGGPLAHPCAPHRRVFDPFRSILTHNLGYVLLHSPLAVKHPL